MKHILVADREAVSPVIATILLVAITVVLAAVLYIMVSGLFNPHNATTQFIGANVSQTGGGTEWTITVSAVSGTVTQNETTLTLLTAAGGTAMPAKTLFTLETMTNGVHYIPTSYGPGTVRVGDRLVIDVTTYPSGTQYQFVQGGSVLATGTLL